MKRFLLAVMFFGAACGGSDSGARLISPVLTGSACFLCAKNSCPQEANRCLGNSWAQGRADGPCADWLACVADCMEDGRPVYDCHGPCGAHISGGCEQCFGDEQDQGTLNRCLDVTCDSDCG